MVANLLMTSFLLEEVNALVEHITSASRTAVSGGGVVVVHAVHDEAMSCWGWRVLNVVGCLFVKIYSLAWLTIYVFLIAPLRMVANIWNDVGGKVHNDVDTAKFGCFWKSLSDLSDPIIFHTTSASDNHVSLINQVRVAFLHPYNLFIHELHCFKSRSMSCPESGYRHLKSNIELSISFHINVSFTYRWCP